MKKIVLTLILTLFCLTHNTKAQEPVKDIMPGQNSSDINYITKVYNLLYFNANDGEHGNELWLTDGTTENTYMVNDFSPGLTSSDPKNLFLYYSKLIINANGNYPSLPSLWTCSGVDNFSSIAGFNNPQNFTESLWFNSFTNSWVSSLYFTSNVPNKGIELCKTNGRQDDTYMVDEVWVGAESSNPRQLTPVEDLLFYLADGTDGVGMYISMSSNTIQRVLKDFSSFGELIKFNGYLFFAGSDRTHGVELYKTHGNIDNTFLVKDISIGSTGSNPNSFFIFNNQLYFTATDQNGTATWKTDGTEAGTIKMKKIINKGIMFKSEMFFAGPDDASGTELWKSDGTDSGTVKVADLNNSTTGSNPDNFIIFRDTLLFTARDEKGFVRLFKTDGTPEGTKLANPYSKINYSHAHNFIEMNNILYFVASDYNHGEELFKWDGKLTPYSTPDPPQNLTVRAENKGVMLLDWWPVIFADGYVIQRCTDSINFTTIDSTLLNKTVLTDSTGSPAGIKYFYRILSYNSKGNSDSTNIISAITVDVLKPEAPYNFQHQFIKHTDVQISWKCDSYYINGYIVERSTDRKNYTILDTVSQNSYTDTTLELMNIYYYRITAFNDAGVSEPLIYATDVSTEFTTLLGSVALGIQNIKQNSMELQWYYNNNGHIQNYDGFIIKRSNDGNYFTTIDSTKESIYLDSALQSNTTYYYKVCAYDSLGGSYFSPVVSGTTLASSGINLLDESEKFLIYPNPVNEQLFIELPGYKNTSLEMFNSEGLLKQNRLMQSSKTIINTSNLARGIYFLKIISTNGVTVKKIIKN